MLIDTHTHLYLPEYANDQHGEGAVQRAIDAGVRHMVMPNVDLTTIAPMKALAARFKGNISIAMGLHPTAVTEAWSDDMLKVLAELADGTQYVAVGEVGIDLYWDKSYVHEQMIAFETQVDKAEQLGLPVIIHCREGLKQALEVMDNHRGVKAVWHSFGGTAADVDRIRSYGDHYFGINGIVTFKNSRVREALHEIGLDRLLLETDSPYLAPVPHRGKRNESAYMTHIAEHIAAYLDVPVEVVASKTTNNAVELFRLPLDAEAGDADLLD